MVRGKRGDILGQALERHATRLKGTQRWEREGEHGKRNTAVIGLSMSQLRCDCIIILEVGHLEKLLVGPRACSCTLSAGRANVS